MANITDDQPLLGLDIAELKDEWNLTVFEIQATLGINPNLWNRINKHLSEPILNESIATLARYYHAHPEKLPFKKRPGLAKDVYERLKFFRPDTAKKDMGLLLGKNSDASFYRWVEYGTEMTPSAAHLARIILNNTSIEPGKIKQSKKFLDGLESQILKDKEMIEQFKANKAAD